MAAVIVSSPVVTASVNAIVNGHPHELRSDHSPKDKTQWDPDGDARQDEPQSRLHDQRESIRGLRPERHANTNLMRPLNRGVCQDAVNPERHQNQPDASENRHANHAKPRPGIHLLVDAIFQRAGVSKATWESPAQTAWRTRYDRPRRRGRAHHQRAGAPPAIVNGTFTSGSTGTCSPRFLTSPTTPMISSALSRRRIRGRIEGRGLYPSPDWILAGQIRPREGLVHDGHSAPLIDLDLAKTPSLFDLNSQTRKYLR